MDIKVSTPSKKTGQCRLEYIVDVYPFAFDRLCGELIEAKYVAIKTSNGTQRHGSYLALPTELVYPTPYFFNQ